MTPPVFHVAELPEAGSVGVLDGPEGRHAATVRRLRVGELLLVTDGRGGVARCTVTSVQRDRLGLDVAETWSVPAASPRVTVVQALPKGERSELAVELTTEAGVDALVPWQAARCVSRWTGDKAGRGAVRWRSVAAQAAKQARRAHVPDVAELHTTPELLALCTRSGGSVLVLHESAAEPLASVALHGDLILVVGPEGGIDDAELAGLGDAGARPVHLGPTVMRTSTAAAVALGAVGVLTGRWTKPPFAP